MHHHHHQRSSLGKNEVCSICLGDDRLLSIGRVDFAKKQVFNTPYFGQSCPHFRRLRKVCFHTLKLQTSAIRHLHPPLPNVFPGIPIIAVGERNHSSLRAVQDEGKKRRRKIHVEEHQLTP